MPVPDDFAAWFRLLETPQLGRTRLRRLLAACGSPQGVLGADPAVWQQVGGSAAAQALAAPLPIDFAERQARTLAWLAQADHHAITLDSPAWPEPLLRADDPPLLLYVQGDLQALHRPCLAIVGSRQASAQGLDNAQAFAAALSAQGYCIVSGLAAGIDGAAHNGALTGPGGTLAVVGTGLDQVYPPRHRALAERIRCQGALLSEYAPGTQALPAHFPQRNRIIAGLSQGTLVVEAALKSGSLITARLANEFGREVFAIPGSIHAPQSRGCHALIKQGAKLVESAEDILEELLGTRGPQATSTPIQATLDGPDSPAGPTDSTQTEPLLAALGSDATTLDALQARTGWATAELMARLLELELDGQVARLPGGLYQRRFRG